MKKINEEKLVQMWNEGKTAREIAKCFGIVKQSIYDAVYRLKKKGVKLTYRGKAAKINKKECKELYLSGISGKKLAAKYGASYQRIYQIIRKMGVDKKDKEKLCIKCNIKIEAGNLCNDCKIDRRFYSINYCKCGNTKTKVSILCMKCAKKGVEINREKLVEMWNIEEKSAKEIAKYFGASANSIGVIIVKMRRKGIKLNYRNKRN